MNIKFCILTLRVVSKVNLLIKELVTSYKIEYLSYKTLLKQICFQIFKVLIVS